MATIKDVAAAANVSIATVSRVINHTGGVSKSTERKVNRAIADLHYTTNETGRVLKTNRTHHIAAILTSMTNTFYTSVIAGIQEEALKSGYYVIFAASNDQPDTEQMLIDSFASQAIDGIILFSCIQDDDSAKSYITHLENLSKRGVPIPVVTMGYSFNSRKIDSISVNYELMAYEAVNCLLRQNRSKILFLSRPLTSCIGTMQLNGYRHALLEAGIPFDDNYVITSEETEYDGYLSLNAFLEKHLPFDAIYCSNDQMAIGAMKGLRKNNIQIPEQVAVFGTEDHFAATLTSPPLSSVSIHKKMFGELAVQQLLNRISQTKESPRLEIMLDYTIIERESSRSDVVSEQKFFAW